MYLDTENICSMENSLMKHFNISKEELEKFAIDAVLKGGTKEEFENYLNKKVNEFYLNNINSVEREIDEIVVFHLSRRLGSDVCSISKESNNLYDLLTSKNDVSDFLATENITIKKNCADKLDLYVDGKKQDLSNIHDSKELNLNYRLNEDQCFNGFLFRDLLENETNGYWQTLNVCPEIIRGISNFIDNCTLIQKYIENSIYVCFKYRVPIDKIIIDDENTDIIESAEANKCNELDIVKKRIVEKTLYTWALLYLKSNKTPILLSEIDNTIIRLQDDFNILSDFLLEIEKIDD